jgi:hypothetical protein
VKPLRTLPTESSQSPSRRPAYSEAILRGLAPSFSTKATIRKVPRVPHLTLIQLSVRREAIGRIQMLVDDAFHRTAPHLVAR